jgi:Mrp family chromosome partitioning ATPase
MPPMLGSDDMQAFAGKVDCVLLVAAAESTTIDEIDRCERDLASQTNVLGVVLNKCRYTHAEYGYGY